MSFLVGLFGIITGGLVGVAIAFFSVSVTSDGNDLGDGFALLGAAPFGLILGALLGLVLAMWARRYWQMIDSDTSARHKKAWLIAAMILVPPALVTALLLGAQKRREPPSDQEMLTNFRQHESVFNQLVQMSQADKGLARVDDDWTQPDYPQSIGVSARRVADYRKLMRAANVPRGLQTAGGGEVDFYYWLTGSAISSDTDKGYAYLVIPPAPLLTDLDHCQPDEKRGVTAYRHVQGNWYLFYEFLPG